jgi:hypothetical protein
MKKMTFRIMFFAAALTGLASCCNGQSSSNKTKAAVNKSAKCSHCGKTSCNKTCSSNSVTEKKDTTMQSKLIPSCSLNEKDLAETGAALSKTIFSKAKSINSLKDGYDIVFNEPKEFSNELLEMVNFERSCCSGFTWALVFEPDNKATHLQVYGSKKIKEEMGNAFKSFGLAHLMK